MAYSTISKPSLHFNTKLYTGNGGTQSITGVGFQPDWVWLKKRNSTADHGLYDAVRGVTKQLYSNDTAAEATNANSLTAFGTDGFSIGTSSMINGNSDTFASWNWKANGAGSANTDGTINTTATSVNTTAGFSISKFTVPSGNGDQSIGHGLGVAPSMMITKDLASGGWNVYHKSLNATAPEDYYLNLNTTSAAASDSPGVFGAGMTSSVAGIGVGVGVSPGNTYIAYCFAEKTGYSKFGKFVGNGSSDGSFVYTGFKPAWIMYKDISGTSDWYIMDTKRRTFNVTDVRLEANNTDAEVTGAGDKIDILSNGFKFRHSSGSFNISGNNYIYMAFAEEPLVANVGASIPATAR